MKAQENVSAHDVVAFLDGKQNASAAELLVSGFEGIRRIVGDDAWPQAMNNVSNIIEWELDKRLGDGDRVFKTGEGSYSVGVVSCGPQDAAALMRQVEEALRLSFHGDDGREHLRIESGLRIVPDGTGGLKEVGVAIGPEPQLSTATVGDLGEPVYLPVWDGQNKILAAYAAAHWASGPDGYILNEGRLATMGDDVAMARLDARTISETSVLVEDFFANSFALRMILVISYRGYNNAVGRSLILGALRGIPESIRKVFTVFVNEIPTDMHPSLVADRLSPMKPLVDAIALAVDSWDDATSLMASTGIFSGVSLNLPTDPVRRERTIDQMPEFCRDVRRMKKVACVGQIQSRLEIDDAITAGVRLLSGGGVGSPIDIPGNVVRCKAGDLPYRP